MDYPGRLIAGLIAIVLIVLFPLQYIAQLNSEDIDAIVSDETKALSDSIREKGYIDQSMYEEYMDFLSQTGEFYDFEIEDIHPVTGEEIACSGELRNMPFDNLISASLENVRSAIPSELEKQRVKAINMSTSNHTHSTDCYPGTLHVCNDINCIYNGKEVLVNIGSYGYVRNYGTLQYSIDKGVTWTKVVSLGYDAIFTDITYGSGKFLAFTSNGAMYYSSDGINWTYKDNPIDTYSTATVRGVVYRNGVFYAITNSYRTINYNSVFYSIYISTDGLNWTKTDSPRINEAMYTFGRLVLTNDVIFISNMNSDAIYYIKPNENVLTKIDGANGAGNLVDIAYYNGTYYGIGQQIWSSTDLVTWKRNYYYTGPGGLGWYISNIFTNNNKLYLLGSGMAMEAEPDGYGSLYWSYLSSIPRSMDYKYVYTYTGDQYYVTDTGLDEFYKSKDLTSFTRTNTATISNYTHKLVCNANNGSGKVDLGPCQKEGKYYDNAGNEVYPICDRVVTGITAIYPNQTVIQGSSIDTTVQATYLDGHTGTVNCSASGYNPNLIGTQTVTLTYTGLVGNARTTGTRTCITMVTVKSARTLTSLTVTPTTQTISRYGTPSFVVKANYSDGINQTLSSGQYTMSGFNSSNTGSQTVTFSYTENGVTKTATTTVLVDAMVAISVSPADQTVPKYTNPAFSVTVSYLYSSNKTITTGYTISGYRPELLGLQNVTISYTESGITKSATARVTVVILKKECQRCHNIYDLRADDSDPGCPFCKGIVNEIKVSPDYVEVTQGDALPITVKAIYNDGSTEQVHAWTSNYNPNTIGLQIIAVTYGGCTENISAWVSERKATCPSCGTQYPISEGKCPVCADIVVSISVEPTEVTVRQYDAIILSVRAYYKDGSSALVTDWSIDHSSNVAGDFDAKVSYKNVYTIIKLKVISAMALQCPLCGLVYEPEDSPKGCPVCSNKLVGIEAYLISGGNLVHYGTYPGIAVVLIYFDSHRELTTNGYNFENYNPYMLGLQAVTVKYKIFSTILNIEVVNTLANVTCPNGHTYSLNEDGSDPGCPYCLVESSLGAVLYYDITYITEILEIVYEVGRYNFEKGNYITIRVTKREKSLFIKMQKTFFKTSMLGRKKRYVYGGEVF